MVRRVVGGAHYGVRDWLAQRLTAVAMVVLGIVFVGFAATHSPLHFAAWRGIFHHQWMRLAGFLFFISACYHAWVGVRDILMDYVKPLTLRLAGEWAAILLLLAYAAWAAQILWSV